MHVPSNDELWEKNPQIIEVFGVSRLLPFPKGVWEMANDLSEKMQRPVPELIEIVATWFELEVFETFAEEAPLEIERRIVKWWMTIWGDMPANGNRRDPVENYKQSIDPELLARILGNHNEPS